jgi:hypothetical protein
MKHLSLVALSLVCSMHAAAQTVPSKLIPRGWSVTSTAWGDLDRDRRRDYAVVIESDSVSTAGTRGRILLVLLARGASFVEATRSSSVIPYGEAAGPLRYRSETDDPFDTLEIRNGSIDLHFSNVGNGGRWWLYRFRRQGGVFRLIGATHGSGNTEFLSKYDYNLNTGVIEVMHEEGSGDNPTVTKRRVVRKLRPLPRLETFTPGGLSVLDETVW